MFRTCREVLQRISKVGFHEPAHDYRKAFETLDHKVLLFKLRKYGLESYLSTRKHRVFCNGVLSKVTEVPYGVPQGSVLGPLFFIIYVNDLLLLLGQNKQISVEMYADDTVIYCSAHDVSIATSLCQSALSVLVEWCENNRLTINTQKSKIMAICRNDRAKLDWKTESLYISNNASGKVNVYKYLGVDLDENLTMNNMIDSTFNKANRKVYLLKKIRPYITREIANRIYKTCILPILHYADFLVDSGGVSFIGKLDTIQKRCLKIIDRKLHPGASANELCQVYNHSSLEDRPKKHLLSVMYRHAQKKFNLENQRPKIQLRNRGKIKFKVPYTLE